VLEQFGQLGSGDGAGESRKDILQHDAMTIGEAFGTAFVLPEHLQHCRFPLATVGDITGPKAVDERQHNGGMCR